ncbi:hypothetical protein ES705_38399 [subsurface metagenome]
MKHKPGSWRLGKRGDTVVADSRTAERPGAGHDDHDDIEYYGGYLVCESIATKEIAQLIAKAPELLSEGQARIKALEGLLVCYRLRKLATEKLLDELARSKTAWEAAVNKAGEVTT